MEKTWISLAEAERVSGKSSSVIKVWRDEGMIEEGRCDLDFPLGTEGFDRRMQVGVTKESLLLKLNGTRPRKTKAVVKPEVKPKPKRRPSQMAVLMSASQTLVDFFGAAAGAGRTASEFQEFRKERGIQQHRRTDADLRTEEEVFAYIQQNIRDSVSKITKEKPRF